MHYRDVLALVSDEVVTGLLSKLCNILMFFELTDINVIYI